MLNKQEISKLADELENIHSDFQAEINAFNDNWRYNSEALDKLTQIILNLRKEVNNQFVI